MAGPTPDNNPTTTRTDFPHQGGPALAELERQLFSTRGRRSAAARGSSSSSSSDDDDGGGDGDGGSPYESSVYHYASGSPVRGVSGHTGGRGGQEVYGVSPPSAPRPVIRREASFSDHIHLSTTPTATSPPRDGSPTPWFRTQPPPAPAAQTPAGGGSQWSHVARWAAADSASAVGQGRPGSSPGGSPSMPATLKEAMENDLRAASSQLHAARQSAMRSEAEAAALRSALERAQKEAAAHEAAARQSHRQLAELQHRTALRPQQAVAMAEASSSAAKVSALEKELESERETAQKQAALTESLQLALSKERELNYSLQSELEQEREKIERALATLPQVASMEASLEDAKQQAAQDIAMLEQRANAAKADFDRVTGELHRRLAEAVKEKEEVAMQLEGQGQKLHGVVQHAETLKEQCRSVQKDRDAAINSLEKAEHAVEALKAEITVMKSSVDARARALAQDVKDFQTGKLKEAQAALQQSEAALQQSQAKVEEGAAEMKAVAHLLLSHLRAAMERAGSRAVRDSFVRVEELSARESVERLAWCFGVERQLAAEALAESEARVSGVQAKLYAAHAAHRLAEEQVDAVAAAASEARETLLGEHRAECAALKAEVEGYRQREVQLKEHAEEVAAKQRQTRSEYEDYMARTQSASDIVVGLQRQLRLAEEKLTRMEKSWREAEAEAREAKREAGEKEAEAEALRDNWAKADADAQAKTDRMRELRAALQNSMEAESATRQIEAAQAETEAARHEVARVRADAAEERELLVAQVQVAERHASAVSSQTLQLWDTVREASLRAQAGIEDALEHAGYGESGRGVELEQAWAVARKQKGDLDGTLPHLHLSLSDPQTTVGGDIPLMAVQALVGCQKALLKESGHQQARFARIEEEVMRLRMELGSAENRTTQEWQVVRSDVSKVLADAERTRREAEERVQAARDEFTHKYNRAESAREEAQVRSAEAEKRCQQYRNEMAAQKETLAAARRTEEKLRVMHAKEASFHGRMRELQERVDSEQQRCRDLRRELAALRVATRPGRVEVAKRAARVRMLRARRRKDAVRIQSLRRSGQELQWTVDRLSKHIKANEKKFRSNATAASTSAAAAAEATQKATRLEGLLVRSEERRATAETERKRLTDSLAALKKEKEEQERVVRVSKEASESARCEVERLRQAAAKHEASENKRTSALWEQLEAAEGSLRDSQRTASRLLQDLEATRNEGKKLRAEVKRLESALSTASAAAREAQRQLGEAQRRMEMQEERLCVTEAGRQRLISHMDGLLSKAGDSGSSATSFVEWIRVAPEQSLECVAERLLMLQSQVKELLSSKLQAELDCAQAQRAVASWDTTDSSLRKSLEIHRSSAASQVDRAQTDADLAAKSERISQLQVAVRLVLEEKGELEERLQQLREAEEEAPLKRSLAAALADKVALLNAARDRKVEVTRLSEELSLRDGELGDARQRIVTLQAEVAALGTAADNSKAAEGERLEEASRQVVDLKEDKAALLSAARDREAEVARLTEELSLRDGELGQAAQRIDTLQAEIAALHTTAVNQKEAEDKRLKEASRQMADVKAEKAAMENAGHVREAEVARLTEELSLRDRELAQAAQRIDTLQAEVTLLREELTEAERRMLEEKTREKGVLEGATSEIEATRSEAPPGAPECPSCAQLREELRHTRTRLSQSVEQREQHLPELEGRAASAERACEAVTRTAAAAVEAAEGVLAWLEATEGRGGAEGSATPNAVLAVEAAAASLSASALEAAARTGSLARSAPEQVAIAPPSFPHRPPEESTHQVHPTASAGDGDNKEGSKAVMHVAVFARESTSANPPPAPPLKHEPSVQSAPDRASPLQPPLESLSRIREGLEAESEVAFRARLARFKEELEEVEAGEEGWGEDGKSNDEDTLSVNQSSEESRLFWSSFWAGGSAAGVGSGQGANA